MKIPDWGSVPAKLAATVLLLAALGRRPHDYYTILRWVACGVCTFTAYQGAEARKPGWLIVFAFLAAALNPIVPLHLKRGTWAYVDAVTAALLVFSIVTMDLRKSRH
jgi:hypothetical protein